MARIVQTYPGETEAEARVRLQAIRGEVLDDEARRAIAEGKSLDAAEKIINSKK